MKSFEFPLLDVPEITDRVIVVAILVRKRDHSRAVKRVWHHAIVLWIDERRVHQLAAAAKLLVDDLHTPVKLSQHTERILLGFNSLVPLSSAGAKSGWEV